jgi:glutathione S-transferase
LWFNGKKHALGINYPNVPALVKGDLRITEHLAILKYLARTYKPDLIGTDAKD